MEEKTIAALEKLVKIQDETIKMLEKQVESLKTTQSTTTVSIPYLNPITNPTIVY